MTNEFNDAKFDNSGLVSNDETYNIPIDISDILTVCREYSQLGYNIQHQIEQMMEVGVEEAVNSGMIKAQVLPLIRSFLQSICANCFFGDACDQAYSAIMMLDDYTMKYPQLFIGNKN